MSKDRLVKEFMELVQIDSESFSEGNFQKELIQRFKALGLQIWEDDTMEQTGLGANNFIARLEGDASIEPLFFSSHIDTVSPGQGIRPIGLSSLYGFPGTLIQSQEAAKNIGETDEEIQIIENEILPKMVVADLARSNKATKGALIGMAVGILAGPFGVLFGTLTGGMIGTSKELKRLKSTEELFKKTIGNIDLGTTGIIAIGKEYEESVLDGLVDELGGKLTRTDEEL